MVEVARRQFTVDEYHRMVAAGILHEDDRVELIEGDIVEMAPIGSSHAGCVETLNWLFSQRVDLSDVFVRVQNPVLLGRDSEPQPDIVLARFRADFYRTAHPTAGDVHLIIEVAESSLDFDRLVKLPLYARSGVPEVWIVDLEGDAVEVYLAPAGDGYSQQRTAKRGESVSPSALPVVSLGVDEILG